MKLFRKKGSTSNIITVFIQDSSSLIGAGLAGLDQTSGIGGGYVREGGTGVALTVDEDVTTEGTYQAPSTAAKVRIGTPASMRPGFYELHFHDSLFATGAETLSLGLGGAANMADLPLEIQLVDYTNKNLYDWLQNIYHVIESQRGTHTAFNQIIHWDPENGNDANSGLVWNEPKLTFNYNGAGGIDDLIIDSNHDLVLIHPGAAGGYTEINEYIEMDKRYSFLRGMGRDIFVNAIHSETCAVAASAEGVELLGFRVSTKLTGSQDGICITGDFCKIRKVWVDFSRGSGIQISNSSHCHLDEFLVQDAAQGGSGHAVHVLGDTAETVRNFIGMGEILENGNGGGGADGVRIDGAFCNHNFIKGGKSGLFIHNNTGWGINEVNGADDTIVVGPTVHVDHNLLGQINLTGEDSTAENVEQWAKDSDTAKQLTGARTITLQLYETATTTPIADVRVDVYNSDQSLFLGQVITDVNGQAVFGRNDGTYKLVFLKAATAFTVPETLTVTQTETKTYYGDSVTIAAPADPDVCRVYEYLFLPDGVTKPAAADVSANAIITALPYDVDGKLHSGADITEVYSAATGLIYWDIVRGATVRFAVDDFGIETSKVIPDLSTARLIDI